MKWNLHNLKELLDHESIHPQVCQRLGKREDVISKLEKDKREVAVARDKALKQIEDIDKAGVSDES